MLSRRYFGNVILIFSMFFWPITAICQGEPSGHQAKWHGYERIDFTVDGRSCYLVAPKIPASGRPWIWRARFPSYHPEVDQLLLERGFHIAYINTDDMLGSNAALKHWDAFYKYMTEQHKLASHVTLEAVSRGGLFAYRWAIQHPECVACVYADTPVLDFKSWPLGKGTGKGHQPTWQNLLKQYDLTHEQALDYTGNPIDNLKPLAEAFIPLYHIVSLNDHIVPPEENTFILQQRYNKMGGEIIVETIKEGTTESGGHHFTLPDPNRAARFIIKNNFDMRPGKNDYFLLRSNLDNCRLKFEREKAGRVVFLGGSITFNAGWRPMVCRELQRRFPETKFEFINAGIPSTGSVPGAFRILRDVFSKGPVDLLFEEAAVNDVTNHPDQQKHWCRGMEGIVRHARMVNPNLDIIILHFVDPDKIACYNAGKTPDVITEHERVAKHYQVSTIHLAQEVAERIHAGQFTWKDDFRDLHPSWYGQRLYTATIKRMLDAVWQMPLAPESQVKTHPQPDPLDSWSYFNGRLVDIKEAQTGKGWKFDPSWKPQTDKEKASTRSGFVNVPMLVTDQVGAELTFKFRGTAVGLWIIAGPDVGIIDYQIDNNPWKHQDQFTPWSQQLHLPWMLILADELEDSEHTLTLRTTANKNQKSCGTSCRIVNFCVNGVSP